MTSLSKKFHLGSFALWQVGVFTILFGLFEKKTTQKVSAWRSSTAKPFASIIFIKISPDIKLASFSFKISDSLSLGSLSDFKINKINY